MVQFIFAISDIYSRRDKHAQKHTLLSAGEKSCSDELTATLWTPTLAQTNPTICDYSSWSASLKSGDSPVVTRSIPALCSPIPSSYHTGVLKKHDVRNMDTWDSLKR